MCFCLCVRACMHVLRIAFIANIFCVEISGYRKYVGNRVRLKIISVSWFSVTVKLLVIPVREEWSISISRIDLPALCKVRDIG